MNVLFQDDRLSWKDLDMELDCDVSISDRTDSISDTGLDIDDYLDYSDIEDECKSFYEVDIDSVEEDCKDFYGEVNVLT